MIKLKTTLYNFSVLSVYGEKVLEFKFKEFIKTTLYAIVNVETKILVFSNYIFA